MLTRIFAWGNFQLAGVTFSNEQLLLKAAHIPPSVAELFLEIGSTMMRKKALSSTYIIDKGVKKELLNLQEAASHQATHLHT